MIPQKLRDAGIEAPGAGKKGAGPQEENRALKEEVKTLTEQLNVTKKGKSEAGTEEKEWKSREQIQLPSPSPPAGRDHLMRHSHSCHIIAVILNVYMTLVLM